MVKYGIAMERSQILIVEEGISGCLLRGQELFSNGKISESEFAIIKTLYHHYDSMKIEHVFFKKLDSGADSSTEREKILQSIVSKIKTFFITFEKPEKTDIFREFCTKHSLIPIFNYNTDRETKTITLELPPSLKTSHSFLFNCSKGLQLDLTKDMTSSQASRAIFERATQLLRENQKQMKQMNQVKQVK
jgi:hypothetical protein